MPPKLKGADIPAKLGWAVLDPREVRQVAQRIASPGSLGTVDELGLGAITDALAVLLFPAFTTLMTRARYFIFVRGVLELAAERAWNEMPGNSNEATPAEYERQFHQFVRIAEREVEAIEFAIALSLRRQPNSKGEQIIGGTNIQRSIRERNLTDRRLFGRQERYPNALYFTGLRQLHAFTSEVGSRGQLWRVYFDRFNDRTDNSPWDADWYSASAIAADQIRAVYKELRSGKAPTGHIRLRLNMSEARFLSARLKALGPIPRSVMEAFLAQSTELSGEDGYRRAKSRCRNARARKALAAAAEAMRAMEPPLTIYRKLRGELKSARSLAGRHSAALSVHRQLGASRLARAYSASAHVMAWQRNETLGPDFIRALTWLHDWLGRAKNASGTEQRLQCVRSVLKREYDVLSRSRNKTPRYSYSDFALTSRGRRETGDEDEEGLPRDARVSSGRLERAAIIFADLRAAGIR